MVQIPTTQRQFHNTTTKANSLALYADALKPAVQNANKIFMQQQKIKIDTRATQARIEADEYVNNMRLQYQGNPDSPEFKQAISGGLHDIFERYGQDIDPMAKGEWNLTANKMTGAYDLSNNEWIIKQRADNAKVDIADKMAIDFDLAYKHGSNGNVAAGKADLEDSYGKLFEYAKSNMGETEAKKLLKDYQRKYTLNYLNGLMNSNPAAAQQMLNDKKTQEVIGSERAVKTLKKISADSATKQMKKYITQKETERKFAYEKLKELENPTIADLEAYKDNFEPDMTDAKYDRLLKMINERNPDADTDVDVDIETAKELKELSAGKSVTLDDLNDFLSGVNDFSDKVHTKNKEGKLSLEQADNYKKLALDMAQNEDLKEAINSMPDFDNFKKVMPNTTNIGLFKEVGPEKDIFENISGSYENYMTQRSNYKAAENEIDDFMKKAKNAKTVEEQEEVLQEATRLGLFADLNAKTGWMLPEHAEDIVSGAEDAIKDEVFMKNFNKIPHLSYWENFVKHGLANVVDNYYLQKDVERIAKQTSGEYIKLMSKGDYEGASNAYKEGMEKAIRLKYGKYIPVGTKLEAGKTILNIDGKICKFMGFGATDICVEVEE